MIRKQWIIYEMLIFLIKFNFKFEMNEHILAYIPSKVIITKTICQFFFFPY